MNREIFPSLKFCCLQLLVVINNCTKVCIQNSISKKVLLDFYVCVSMGHPKIA